VIGGVTGVIALLAATLGLAAAAGVVVRRNRVLRRRPGDVSVLSPTGWGGRWCPGHGVWVGDVFAFRRSPAGWNEALIWVSHAFARGAADEERRQLQRLGDEPVVVTFTLACGGTVKFAARAKDRVRLLGPYAEPLNGLAAVAR
jgi:hypothetical protein